MKGLLKLLVGMVVVFSIITVRFAYLPAAVQDQLNPIVKEEGVPAGSKGMER